MVGDGHAVGVAAEIAQHMWGAAEGRLGIDEPFLLAQLSGHLLEPGGITEIGCGTSAIEQSLAVEPANSVEELFAEQGSQDRNGQQEQRVAGVDPAPVVSRQTAGGNHAVDMVMGTPTPTIP